MADNVKRLLAPLSRRVREYIEDYVRMGLTASARKHNVSEGSIRNSVRRHAAYVEELRAAMLRERRGEMIIHERLAMRTLAQMMVASDKALALEATREIYRRFLECHGGGGGEVKARQIDIQVWSARLRELYSDRPDELLRVADEYQRTGELPELG